MVQGDLAFSSSKPLGGGLIWLRGHGESRKVTKGILRLVSLP